MSKIELSPKLMDVLVGLVARLKQDDEKIADAVWLHIRSLEARIDELEARLSTQPSGREASVVASDDPHAGASLRLVRGSQP